MYSQNNEEDFIVKHFDGFVGSLLSIGENDGKTFSNALRLIELGWSATLVEPSPDAFAKLELLHKGNKLVHCVNIAIGNSNGTITLHESGAHVRGGNDIALVSSLIENETAKWKKSGVKFNPVDVSMLNYKTFAGYQSFDFITIDAEGMDIEILKQINLLGTKLICIEWNGNEQNKIEILKYTSSFGMQNVIYENIENLLIGR